MDMFNARIFFPRMITKITKNVTTYQNSLGQSYILQSQFKVLFKSSGLPKQPVNTGPEASYSETEKELYGNCT